MSMNHDAVGTGIIGAGPAGCSAAIVLARQGFRVALLEAGEVGREKLCGEFLSPECGGLLKKLGLDDRIYSLSPVDIQAARMTAPEGTVCEIALPEIARGLSRSALDAALWEGAKASGADALEKTAVQNVSGDLPGGFELKTTRGTLRARSVISAHGRRATLDRIIDRAFLHHPQPFVALKAHFVGPPLHRRVELHFFPGGYCGLAEIEGGRANVCLLVRAPVFSAAVRSSREPLDAFVDWMKVQNPYLDEWLSRARRVDVHWLSAAQIPFIAKSIVEHDILMAGDAARLVVPLAGDGIAMALQSGMMAGELCASYLKGERSPRELTQGYAAGWERAFGERVRLGRILQSLVLRPQLVGLALRAFNSLPLISGYLVRHTRTQLAPISSSRSRKSQ
jgi:flavin-dependent dehydrogenase